MPLFTPLLRQLVHDMHANGLLTAAQRATFERRFRRQEIAWGAFILCVLVLLALVHRLTSPPASLP